ncbi:D-alanyl-D-alanine carboxypeptidase [Alkalibaculum sp. M08DMB]|uniref:serine-type D-Ala-D-Ala carboxypeptidase n=1 Tax=Alkalibaculum sporogenes TaxID=2655001 RepID=A0A6A7K6X9_9FIRM|nr:D-alanyl-D-alanine carboxypeptidase family protein [Alkalibaculum sporogenes]MPW25200.1 D-alanyl-D-alanine carboxypeptidase [Alkalibaculum sporogenes]
MIKKYVVVLCLFILFNLIFPITTYGVEVGAKSAILIEEKTGRILYNKNIDQVVPMASTTKIMSAIVALEYGDLSDIVVVDDKAAYVEGSSIYINKDDEIRLEDLVYALMLRSGNDAAYTIANHIAGSEENFVELMNKKAEVIGANNTHFMNPHGLHHDEHYTTARDMALITQYAFKNKDFKKIIGTTKTEIQVNDQTRVIYNKNKLLTGYEGGNGVKTGYTMAAGKCLVFSATQAEMQVIGVVLDAWDIWNESRILLDYGFENYNKENALKKGEYIATIYIEDGINEQIKIISNENVDIPLKQGENIERTLTIDEHIRAPIFNKQKVGLLEFFVEDKLVYSKELYSPQKVYEKNYIKFLNENIRDFFTF